MKSESKAVYKLEDLSGLLPADCTIAGNTAAEFDNVKPVTSSNRRSLSWIKSSLNDPLQVLKASLASVVVCPQNLDVPQDATGEKLILFCGDPKLVFTRIATKLFGQRVKPGIHPTAIIQAGVKIGNNVYVGPHTVIEEGAIGDDCIIHGNCYLLGPVTLGNRVTIFPGTVIGGDGFGYSRNSEGRLEKFPHFGGVVVMDDAEIGSNTSIDRGSLGDTVIGKGVKVDNLVHVAHNVEIGDHSMIIANTMIGGSTKIAAGSWVAPSVSLLNGISIGENAVVGMGAVVTKSIPPNQTWAGSPARPIDELVKINRKLKEL